MPETRDLLFELGTEELPPRSLRTLSSALSGSVKSRLADAGVDHGPVQEFATPRRLALVIEALASQQADRINERRGPALSAAYDPDGKPTKATEGFARSCGVDVAELIIISSGKGEWLGFREQIRGGVTTALLPELFRSALADLPIAKRMRWGSSDHEFVRPVHWCVLLYGDELVNCDILGAKAGRRTRGHRFHCSAPIELSSPAAYSGELMERGKVIAGFEDRMQRIERLAADSAAAVNGVPHYDAALLDEVAALVEWPVAVLGRYDARFLALPPEVLITTLQANQKYFPIKDREGALLPYFLTFSNLESTRPETVRAGNERVVTPRLADAEFFWNQDRKTTLEQRVEKLSGVTFQAKLGSLFDKVRRVQRLAAWIADERQLHSEKVERAAYLCKADLLSEMVGEFPNLQGIMGRHYALAEGEDHEVGSAIEEHYRPRYAGDTLPDTATGQCLAIADKTDTLVGIFSIGLIPTGDRDPYALRRAALGVIRILVEKQLDLDLYRIIDRAITSFVHPFDANQTLAGVIEFTNERLRGYFLDHGWRPDEIESVLSLGNTRPLDCEQRLRAVRDFRGLPEASSLAAANKRIRNLLRKSLPAEIGTVEPRLFEAGPEADLFACAEEARTDLNALLPRGDYVAALARLAQLRDPVDRFFDAVLVMAEDEAVRRNRVALLALIEGLFLRIADIGKLQG